MQCKIIFAISLALSLVACDQGVQIANQADIVELSTTNFDPFNSKEPLLIDDTEAREFVNIPTGPVIAISYSECSSDLDIITPAQMSYTNGFARDAITDDNPVDAIRARNSINRDDAHYIEVCIESSTDREYYIEAFVRGPSVREDSFYFTIDDSAPLIYDVGRYNPDRNGYVTDAVRSRDTDPLRVSLKAGRNIIRFHYRERNTALAQLKFLRLPSVTPIAETELESTEFSRSILACARETNLPPEKVATLIEQHLPTLEPEFSMFGNFSDYSFNYRYFITDNLRNSPRVFCLRDYGPTRGVDGLQETGNIVYPSDAPTLILGSAGSDIVQERPMGDNIVFYGFAGNDSVKWQIGGEFFGGDDNDIVIGLTDGFFDGESGQNTVEAATTTANIFNADIVRANIISPEAPSSLEIVGEDDYNVHVRWPEAEKVLIDITNTEDGRSYLNNQYQLNNNTTNLGPNFGGNLLISGRSVLVLDDQVSLLSSETTDTSFSKPELSELITRFNGELIRGPERFSPFTDATTLPEQLRWMSATSNPYLPNAAVEPLIQMRFADQSTIDSISRDTLGQMLDAEFTTPCEMITGESTHTVVAVTENNVEAFGFDADTLQMRWRHEISTTDNYSSVCDHIFYADGSLYLENRDNSRLWTNTVRVTDNGDFKRIPAPQLANDGFNQHPARQIRLSSANEDIAISFYRAQNTGPEFPFNDRTILVVHNFSNVGSPFQTFTLQADESIRESDFLGGTFRTVTDGSTAWLVASTSEFNHTLLRINLSNGKVEAMKQYESADELFSYIDDRPNLIKLTKNVIEIGRRARIIRIDANTLERLTDVKVAGTVVAFDQDKVITTVSDAAGISAYSFGR